MSLFMIQVFVTLFLFVNVGSFSAYATHNSSSECTNYTVLDSYNRSQAYTTYLVLCDRSYITDGLWYRFMGDAGTAIATSCVPTWRCGTHASGWMNGAHPTQAEGIVNRTVCYHWISQCCNWQNNIRVKNCGGFYVYKLMKPPACYLRYCGNGTALNSSSISPSPSSSYAVIATSVAGYGCAHGNTTCLNGGTCRNSYYGYYCSCHNGYSGRRCETTWCTEKNIQTPLENMTLGQLDTNLRRFYAEARTTTGEMYGRSTLLGFRHAIESHLNLPPYNRNVKMSTDPRFQRSNLMLDAQLVHIVKRNGKDNPVHEPTIEDEDLAKLRSSEALSLKSPVSLLCNVWFNIVLFFCRREGQRDLTKSSFKFEVDAGGRKYVTMAHDELTKNHQGGLKDHTTSTEKYARMYETNDENDGYKALQLYLTKLNPKINALFQYPKKNWEPTDQVWYEAKPIGVNKLDTMMKTISEIAAGLSRVYTKPFSQGNSNHVVV